MKRICSKIIKGLAVTLAPDFSIEVERSVKTRDEVVTFKWWDSDVAERPIVYQVRVEDAKAYLRGSDQIITDVSSVFKWHRRQMHWDAEKWMKYVDDVAHGRDI